MRLLKLDEGGELRLTEDLVDKTPPYAILSHTWGADEDEVTFDDINVGSGRSKRGYAKLLFCAKQAWKDRLKYVWVDTCCIKKADLAELSEAITSMFRWYQNAERCYVYLSDVTTAHSDNDQTLPSLESAFRESKWFTRGWTLQELLAPGIVEFFSRDGQCLGSKGSLEQQILKITGIPTAALRGDALSNFSVEERFRWAEGRVTRKIEDRAYCLLGIFSVFMPLMYGEGDNAFQRLRKEIGPTSHQIDEAIQQTYLRGGRLAVERLSGERLSLKHCFINLSIVDHIRDRDTRLGSDGSSKPLDTGHLLSKFSLDARLKVETPPESKQVVLKTLFNLRNRSDGTQFRPTRILIWGRAGMGKTTLCKKMVDDFYSNGLWRDLYDRVIWLPLRRLKLMANEAHNPVELVQKEFISNIYEDRLAAFLEKVVINGERTLFILDGLDEVSYALDQDSSMGRILDSLLGRSNIIITSRPHSTRILDYTPVDLELETIGFFPKQVEEYLRCAIKQTNTSEETVSEILSFIQNRPLVQSLVRIPVQLDAITYAWDMKGFPNDSVTMTTLYQAISQRLWEKDILRLEKKSDGELITREQIQFCTDIEDFVEDETDFVQELGFQGLCQEIIEFDTEAIRELCMRRKPMLNDCPVRISFLRSSDNSLEPFDRTLHFIHLTFQEFFAAKYFVRHWRTSTTLSLRRGYSSGRGPAKNPELVSPEDFLRREKYIGRYDIFWRFVVGLLHIDKNAYHIHRFFDVLDGEPFDLIGLTHQRLTMHCLSEIGPADGRFQPRIRELEENYVQWTLFESNFKTSVSRTSLIWESECSDYVLETLLKGRYEVKTEVMKMLCHRSSLSSKTLDIVLHEFHGSADKNLRSIATRLLGQQCSQSHEEKFLKFFYTLQDFSKIAQLEIVEALTESSSLQHPAVKALVTLLRDPDSNVRFNAALALRRQTTLPDSAVEALISLLQDLDPDVRSNAASALESQTTLPDSAVEALISLLQDPDSNVRFNAALALRRQTTLPDSVVEALTSLLQDPDPDVRSNAASVLRGQTTLPDSAVKALISLLQDLDPNVRFNAASGLVGQTTLPDSVVEALTSLLQDLDPDVRSNATWALRSQTTLPDSAVEALISLLRDIDESVQSRAADVLGSCEGFYSQIPELDSLSLQILFKCLLQKKNVTCFVWKSNFYLDINGNLWRLPLQPGQQEQFEDAWAEAQEVLGVPLSLHDRKGNITSTRQNPCRDLFGADPDRRKRRKVSRQPLAG